MFLKDAILSRFFHSGKNRAKEGARQKKQEVRAASLSFGQDCLQLAIDHPVNQLWRMRTEESDWMPAPSLCLPGSRGGQAVLNPEETKRELSRLLFVVSSTANKRLIAAREESILSSDMDAEVVVFLTSGDLTAWFLVYPPVGRGREVDREMLAQALRENGVGFGVDEALLDALPRDPERYFHMHLAACGKAPVHGKDGYVEDLFSRHVRKAARVNESGQVDYTELNLVQNVNEGDVICRIVQPTPGEPGMSVSGQAIPNRKGKPAAIPQGRNTALSRDGNSLVATSVGRVEFSGRSFQVKPVLQINGNVDYSTGNIHFMGDVEIGGDVCSGFQVKALGNITVGGVVESCSLEAGGDLVIRKGVKGDNQATIQARRGVYARYLENCDVCAGEILQSDCVINCNVYSDGSVRVDSGRGVIIGGKIRAAAAVRARAVGSKAGCHTIVELGGMPGREFEHECLRQEIVLLESALEILGNQPDSPAKRKSLSKVQMKLSAGKKELAQYEEKMEALRLQGQVRGHVRPQLVCGTAYPGTEVAIGGASMRISGETRNCRAALVDGEIRLL